nr:hypothetical protein [Tanacetum cinerariifolium]
MADLTFVDQHNMVACLERIDGNAEFHQIVDFLTTSPIHYALTVSPTIYASYIERFWATAKSKIVNNVNHIHATFDGKTAVISESLVRRDLHFNDEVFTNMKRQNKDFSRTVTPLFSSMLVPQVVETHTPRRTKRGQDTKIPQSCGPSKKVGDEAVATGEDDKVVKAATTATSLKAEKESGNINKTQSMEKLNKPSPHGTGLGSIPRCQDTTFGDADNTSGSREDSMEHQDDLRDFIPPTPHDIPISRGHTPGSDEDCSRIGDQKVVKESQKIGKKQRARTLGMNLFKIECDINENRDDIDDMVDEAMENVEGDTVNTTGAVNTATTGVSAASASVTTTSVSITIVESRTVKDSGKKDDSSSKQAGSKKKRAGSKLKPKSPKKLKVMKEQESVEDEQEKEELRLCLKIVQYKDKAINYKTLAVKSPIVDWETYLLGSDLQGEDLRY